MLYNIGMAAIDIRALIWDDWNEAHIWERHHLTRAEVVEEVCYGDPEHLKLEDTHSGRYRVIGPKREEKSWLSFSRQRERAGSMSSQPSKLSGKNCDGTLTGRERAMSERVYKGPSYPTQAHGPIPAFSSYEEEADWWDKVDTGAAEFEEAFTPASVRSTRGFTRKMMLRLDEETDNELERYAQEQGLKKSTLARFWLKERLRQERERHAS